MKKTFEEIGFKLNNKNQIELDKQKKSIEISLENVELNEEEEELDEVDEEEEKVFLIFILNKDANPFSPSRHLYEFIFK